MLLSQKLANFTKGEADTLRKAMGKKPVSYTHLDVYKRQELFPQKILKLPKQNYRISSAIIKVRFNRLQLLLEDRLPPRKRKKQSILVIAMRLKSAIISTSITTVFIRRFKPLRIFMN